MLNAKFVPLNVLRVKMMRLIVNHVVEIGLGQHVSVLKELLMTELTICVKYAPLPAQHAKVKVIIAQNVEETE